MIRRSRTRGARPNPADQFYNEVAAELISKLEAGTAPWQQGWTTAPRRGLPTNLSTGDQYRGMNVIRLESTADSRGYDDERWGTYKQIQALGGQVRKGEKSVQLLFWKRANTEPAPDPENPTAPKPGRRLGYAYVFRVFNAEQADGLPARPIPNAQRWPPIETADRALLASGARIIHDGGNRAYYDHRNDSIHLPAKKQFAVAANYYQSALHELGHWTGHASRLNRETLLLGVAGGPNSSAYAREELRAEISSMFVGRQLNIGHDVERHASYVTAWIQALRNDSSELQRAVRDAQQMSDYIIDRARHRDPELDKALSARPPETPTHPRGLDRTRESSPRANPDADQTQGKLFHAPQREPQPAARGRD